MDKNQDDNQQFWLLDLIPNGIVVVRSDYSICFWNACMVEWTGISPEEAEGTNFIERYPAFKNPSVFARISQLFEGGPAVLFSSLFHPHLVPCPFPNGDLRVEKISFIPFHHTTGRCAMVMIEDVSGLTNQVIAYRDMKKVAETQLDDLKKARDAIYLANKKLKLLSGITRHDINNQLTVLMGFLSIVEDMAPGSTRDEYFRKINTSAERISAMIRFTEGYEEVGAQAPAWYDLPSLVDATAIQAPLGQIMVENNLPSGTEIFADPLIIKVFYNLMDNASRYGGKITTIRFSIENRDKDEVIVCADDGVGIPAGKKVKIFERGFGKNTGLGLALSREILDITGITIIENGEPGKGARFEIMVPKGMYR
jgi:signal transduction histidine kinase